MTAQIIRWRDISFCQSRYSHIPITAGTYPDRLLPAFEMEDPGAASGVISVLGITGSVVQGYKYPGGVLDSTTKYAPEQIRLLSTELGLIEQMVLSKQDEDGLTMSSTSSYNEFNFLRIVLNGLLSSNH